VQVHLRKVYRKLGVNSRSAAVAKALRNKLVD
jgi:DNA-binding CsgD family transcriptional regulator